MRSYNHRTIKGSLQTRRSQVAFIEPLYPKLKYATISLENTSNGQLIINLKNEKK